MRKVLSFTNPLLPVNKPRYLMGVGRLRTWSTPFPRDRHVDCVMPTRSGCTPAFTPGGALNLRNASHADDPRPLDADCHCPCCRQFSRANLHHLVKAGEMLGGILLTWHNLHYYQELMARMRKAISDGRFQDFARDFQTILESGDIAPLYRLDRRMNDNKIEGLTQLGGSGAMAESPEAAVLECAPNPKPGRTYLVRFTAPEFTSLCPLTGQPDFAHIVLDYVPRKNRGEQPRCRSRQFSQPWRLPRRRGSDHRREDHGNGGAEVAAHRRILQSPRRHSHRCLPSNLGTAGGTLLPDQGVPNYRSRGICLCLLIYEMRRDAPSHERSGVAKPASTDPRRNDKTL